MERGEEIRIVVDREADRRGSYGRLLVYLYDDGNLLNLQLIQQGYARLYDTAFTERSTFADAEATAQANDVGVWDFDDSTPTPTETPTDTPSESSGDLGIAQIHADAAGNDHENENDEYIVFENTGEATLDLSGWEVRDEADHTYTFPDGFTLEPGQQITLYTGSGKDTGTDLYWGSDAAVWNNGGDTISIYDQDGERRVERSYS